MMGFEQRQGKLKKQTHSKIFLIAEKDFPSEGATYDWMLNYYRAKYGDPFRW